MNRDFTRYQPLPLTPALSRRERENRSPTQAKAKAIGPWLVSSGDARASGDEPKINRAFCQRRLLSPLPEGEGQGEGKRTVTSRQLQSVNPLRA